MVSSVRTGGSGREPWQRRSLYDGMTPRCSPGETPSPCAPLQSKANAGQLWDLFPQFAAESELPLPIQICPVQASPALTHQSFRQHHLPVKDWVMQSRSSVLHVLQTMRVKTRATQKLVVSWDVPSPRLNDFQLGCFSVIAEKQITAGQRLHCVF